MSVKIWKLIFLSGVPVILGLFFFKGKEEKKTGIINISELESITLYLQPQHIYDNRVLTLPVSMSDPEEFKRLTSIINITISRSNLTREVFSDFQKFIPSDLPVRFYSIEAVCELNFNDGSRKIMIFMYNGSIRYEDQMFQNQSVFNSLTDLVSHKKKWF